MTATSVLGADKPKEPGSRRKGGPDTLERVLAFIRWTGLALFMLGSVDLGLTWLPTDFGNREWEFATVTASFNGMPVILIGFVFVAGAAAVEGRRWWALGSGIIGLVLLAFVLGSAVLWATNIPLAMGAADGAAMTLVKKAVFKTAVQSVILPVVFGVVSYHGLKTFRATRKP